MGAYQHPSKTVVSAMDALTAITESWWFALGLGAIAGGALFMWVDYFIRSRDAPASDDALVGIGARAVDIANRIDDHLNTGSNRNVQIDISAQIAGLNIDLKKINIAQINFVYPSNLRLQYAIYRSYLRSIGELLIVKHVDEARRFGTEYLLGVIQELDEFHKSSEPERSSIPQRFLDLLDAHDERVNYNLSTASCRIGKNFDAADPFIVVNVSIRNSSMFEVFYEGIEGRLYYRDDPMRATPEVITHALSIKSNGIGEFAIRQFVSAEMRDRMVAHGRERQIQDIAPSHDFCLKFHYFNRHDEKKEARWTILPDLFTLSGD